MRLSWQEIRSRARAFSERWADAHYEKGETQSFYNEFFHVFGVDRKKVAIFEKRVEMIERNKRGFIDLFWPGVLLVEQKSAGRDLLAAQQQAFDYILGIKERDHPKHVLTCDFQRFKLLNLETRAGTSFTLPELHKHVEAFAFIMGVERRSFGTQAAVNIKAAELMGKLHDSLEASGYKGHDLERLLVRLLFCLFADDTGIFTEKDDFLFLVEERTADDGSDVGRWLNDLFDVLDTPEGERQTHTDAELKRFPYINGALFTERLRTAHFDARMRDDLIAAAKFDWGKVSPAIFGSLFQSVMDAKERRKKGAHYTTETNIMKVIGPLFLDELKTELGQIKGYGADIRGRGEKTVGAQRRTRLLEFQRKLRRVNFLDPACGCGNFLVITYRELRVLELEVLRELYAGESVLTGFDASLMSVVNVDQFYGIEFEEFPAYIAEVAMWMTDHLANNEISLAFGKVFARIPLRQSAHIRHGDALEVNWDEILPHEKCFAVLGNPPFVGAKLQSSEQRSQVRRIAALGGSGGTLDYVAAWFIRAGAYLAKGATRIGFVATNSITQGEQVAQLWPILFDRYGLEIAFAHQTFAWGSDARGKAHVHVVIVGLTHRAYETEKKRLFTYDNASGEANHHEYVGLSAYLTGLDNKKTRHIVVKEESRPINGARRLKTGVQMIDDGIITFTNDERAAFLALEPKAKPLFRKFLGGDEYINDFYRWILYLAEADPAFLKKLPEVSKRMKALKKYRESSGRPSTVAMAKYPTRLGVDERLKKPFLVIPNTSSERRDYIPIGWLSPKVIANQKLRILPDATKLEFGLLTSSMHMAWMRAVTGRLESRYMYSVGVVYNTFPLPDATPDQRDRIETFAQAVLDARDAWPTSSLADLYDPDTMPANLRKAHAALDLAVDRLYRREPFATDRDRVEHLFGRYETLVNPLEREGVKQNKRVARKTGKAGEAKAR